LADLARELLEMSSLIDLVWKTRPHPSIGARCTASPVQQKGVLTFWGYVTTYSEVVQALSGCGFNHSLDNASRSSIVPNEGWMKGFPRSFVPEEGRLSLVGDANPSEVVRL
jgi:hypothetical protein